jgi:hypothetical protein
VIVQNGTNGAQGGPGATGAPGSGTLTLNVKFNTLEGAQLADQGTYPAPGVDCFTSATFGTNSSGTPASGTTNSLGVVSFTLPAGTYDVYCKGADYNEPAGGLLKTTVSVAAAVTTVISPVLIDRHNPVYFTTYPVFTKAAPGASTSVATAAAAAGGATITYALDGANSLSTVTVNADGTFTMPGLDVLLSALNAGKGKWKAFKLRSSPGLLGIGDGATQSLAVGYTIVATATDGTNTATYSFTVGPAGVQDVQGYSPVPLGVPVVADGGSLPSGASGYDWALTTVPASSTASVTGSTTRIATFIPDLEGTYVLTDRGRTPNTVLTIVAAKYQGVAACANCHNGTTVQIGPDATQWFTDGGVHGNTNYFNPSLPAETIFQWGLQGLDYRPTCFQCHTTGAWFSDASSGRPNPTVENGGFLTTMIKRDNDGTYNPSVDVSKAGGENQAWVGDGMDHWTTLDDGYSTGELLKPLAGIQCESCHGPGSQHNGNTSKINVPWGVKACAVCHDAPGHHDKVELWSQSLHNNTLAARGEGNPAPDCARCHTAQGFAAMADNINANGSADLPSDFTPLTAGQGEPQTCQACHDPHTTTLRIDGDIAMTPDGYGFSGVGAGAVCLGCHVARGQAPETGAVGDPHHGPQGDIVFGVNGYFVSGINVSRHAAVADVCVGCHVKLVPDSVTTTNDNHTFSTDLTICKNCHGTEVNGEAIQSAVEGGLAQLATRLGGAVMAAINANSGLTVTDTSSKTYVLSGGTSSGVIMNGSYHGQPAWTITFTGDVADVTSGSGTPAPQTNFQVTAVLASMWQDSAKTTRLMATDGIFAKALWNYLLVEEDRSEGIHNPSYVFDLINATLAQTF